LTSYQKTGTCKIKTPRIRRTNIRIFVLVGGLLLIASCAHNGGLSSAFDINGTWTGQLAGVMGGPPITLTFNFKGDRGPLPGTVNGAPGQWIPLKDGKIKGNKISFEVAAGADKMKMTTKYKGKIKGDKIKLSYTIKMSGRRIGGFSATGFYLGGRGDTGVGMGSAGMGMGGAPSQSLTLERVE
jgi:hypothetical protein